jgi:2-oxoisovalerate dehydrogenase E1 component alpha subunit
VTARASGTDLEPNALLVAYHTMVMARAIERRLWVLDRLTPPPLGEVGAARMVGSPTLVSAGFEAVQVAAAAALQRGRDWVVPCNLDLALCLAMGLSALDVMLSIFGRAADPSSGARQAPGAFGSRACRIVMTSASAGRHVVQAAGIAYASKIQGVDQVTLVCTDERGIQCGDWHEAMNFAGAHALPLVCLIEDRAGDEGPIPQNWLGSPIARAEGYGLAAEAIDGGDFADAFAAFRRATARARTGGGPTVIHAPIVDLTSRKPGGGLRPPEELEALAGHDPVERMRRRLLAAGVLDESADDNLQRECASVVRTAVEEAKAAPSPKGPQALDNVLWRRPDDG